MKKTILALIIFTLAVCTLSAKVEPASGTVYDGIVNGAYMRTSARMNAMGGAGISGFSNTDALYVNPANLANKGNVIAVPEFNVTLYNVKKLMDDDIASDVVKDFTSITDHLSDLLGIYNLAGKNDMADVDFGINMKFGSVGFGIQSSTKAMLNKLPSGDDTDLNIIPTEDVSVSLGFGWRFFRDKAISLDVGAAARLNVRGYIEGTKFTDFAKMAEDDDFSFNDKYVAAGYALPIDIGVNLNIPFGFTASFVVRNINGDYKMHEYAEGLDNALDNISKVTEQDFTISVPMTYNAGLGWNPRFKGFSNIIDPSIVVDFVDLEGLFEDFSTENIILHTKVGAEVRFVGKMLELRGGLNQGYITFGCGLNIFNIIHIEGAYFYQEFGTVLGAKPVDAFQLRASLVWDKQ